MIILGITGKAGSGKGEVVNYLEKIGVKHFSVREVLMKEIDKLGYPHSRESAIKIGNILRREKSPTYVMEMLYEQAMKSKTHSIIESVRTSSEVDFLKMKSNFYLVAVVADLNLRYERIKKRNKEFDSIDFETFAEQDERESTSVDPREQNLDECIRRADITISNENSLEELHAQIEKTIVPLLVQ